MITGTVSLVSVIFTSIIAKIVDYRYKVKKYLYDKREIPYEQFVNMIYTLIEDVEKPEQERMTESEMLKKILEFSKGLTLWGSNRVVKKWLKYRKTAHKISNETNLFLLEEIIYEIRRDVGQRKKLEKGDILSLLMILMNINNKNKIFNKRQMI